MKKNKKIVLATGVAAAVVIAVVIAIMKFTAWQKSQAETTKEWYLLTETSVDLQDWCQGEKLYYFTSDRRIKYTPVNISFDEEVWDYKSSFPLREKEGFRDLTLGERELGSLPMEVGDHVLISETRWKCLFLEKIRWSAEDFICNAK